MADARGMAVAEPAVVVLPPAAAGGAGNVILGGVCKYFEFFGDSFVIHGAKKNRPKPALQNIDCLN